MPRTIIELPTAQLAEVDRLCGLLGISRAEAVRRALDAFVAGNAEVRTEGFGLWGRAPATPGRPAAPRKGRR